MTVKLPAHRCCRFLFIALLAVLAACPGAVLANVSINVAAGYLRQNATTALPTYTSAPTNGAGALLLLVAAGGNNGTTFTNTLSPGQYVAGGDIILAAFQFNNIGGSSSDGTGSTTTDATGSFALPSGVTGGTTPVELRWFSSVAFSQYKTVFPAAGSTYGNYNPLLYHPTGSDAPDGGGNWVVPADGSSSYQLNFYTTDNTYKPGTTGSQAPAEGYASFTVVPEPSAMVLLGGGLVGLSVWRRRHRRVRLG